MDTTTLQKKETSQNLDPSCRISYFLFFLRLNKFALCDRSLIVEKQNKEANKTNFLCPQSLSAFFLYSYDTFPNRASHSRLYIYINIFCCICVIWCEHFVRRLRFICLVPFFLNISAAYSSVFRCLCLVVKKNTYCYSVF